MAKKRIFISCGQRNGEEKNFGREIQQLINQNKNLEGFFAEEAHDASDLNTALFRELQRCDGFVAVAHKRGEILDPGFDVTHRASVWIQQEIGILFYRSFLLGRPEALPMRIYIEQGILHEGLTRYSIINPIWFDTKQIVIDDLSKWLEGPSFEEQPVLARREDLFRRRALTLSDHEWLILEITAAHSRRVGDPAIRDFVQGDFCLIVEEAGIDHEAAPRRFENALSILIEQGVIVVTNIDNRLCLRIQPQWWDLVLDELRTRERLK